MRGPQAQPVPFAQVIVPEFGIEKRVHADQMPLEVSLFALSPLRPVFNHPLLQNHVFDEHNSTLQLYWSDRDVISFLAERQSGSA